MKKIMFNDQYGLTDAVLQGRKTMMRRVVTDYEFNKWDGRQIMLGYDPESNTQDYGLLSDDGSEKVVRRQLLKYPCRCGEVLAVAQSYNDILEHFNDEQWRLDYVRCVEDAYEKLWDDVRGINNKMFVKSELMPHQIKITDIKVERLQDISDEDIMKEGITYIAGGGYGVRFGGNYNVFALNPIVAFADLIDAVSGKGTWERNPWVFAYSFELCK